MNFYLYFISIYYFLFKYLFNGSNKFLTYNKKENKIQILAKETETKLITLLITTIKDKLMTFSDSLDNNYSIYKLNSKNNRKKRKIFYKKRR